MICFLSGFVLSSSLSPLSSPSSFFPLQSHHPFATYSSDTPPLDFSTLHTHAFFQKQSSRQIYKSFGHFRNGSDSLVLISFLQLSTRYDILPPLSIVPEYEYEDSTSFRKRCISAGHYPMQLSSASQPVRFFNLFSFVGACTITCHRAESLARILIMHDPDLFSEIGR